MSENFLLRNFSFVESGRNGRFQTLFDRREVFKNSKNAWTSFVETPIQNNVFQSYLMLRKFFKSYLPHTEAFESYPMPKNVFYPIMWKLSDAKKSSQNHLMPIDIYLKIYPMLRNWSYAQTGFKKAIQCSEEVIRAIRCS